MMRLSAFVILFVVCALYAAPGFARKPACKKTAEGLKIEFAAKSKTDCAVWITDSAGNTVRHLAAGLMAKTASSQVWDGKDDNGNPVPKGRYTARVGLGLKTDFSRVLGADNQWLGSVHGLAVNGKGELFAYCGKGVVVLDRNGKYLRQVAPARSDFPVSKLAGLDPVKVKSGWFFNKDYHFPGSMVGQMALTPQGKLLLPGPGRYNRNLTMIGTDGSVDKNAFEKRLTTHADVGYLYLTCSPDGKTLYFSGAEAGYQGDDAREVSYRQAVYRLKLDGKGPAEIFLGDDENMDVSAFIQGYPKGLATDSAGRLYVCDYTRDWENGKSGGISVYTPKGSLIRTLPVAYPRLVAVHPKTGALYVIAGREEAITKDGFNFPALMKECRLVRLSADGKEEASLKIEDGFTRLRKNVPSPEYRVCMAADFSGVAPVIWLGLAEPSARWGKWSLLRIEDKGAAFSGPVNVCPVPRDRLADGPLKLALDRKSDILYVPDEYKRLLRLKGDGMLFDYNAYLVPVPEESNRVLRLKGDSTVLPPLRFTGTDSAGKPFTWMIAEAAVDGRGDIYILGFKEWQYADTRVLRFTPDGKPLPFSATESRQGIVRRNAMKGATGARGFTVAPDGKVYVIYYDLEMPPDKRPAEAWDRGFTEIEAVAQFDSGGRMVNPRIVSHLRAGGQGVRVDRAGNILVADNFMPLGISYPSELAAALPDPLKRDAPAMLADGSVDPILRYMGSIIQFGPAGGSITGLPENDNTPPVKKQAGDLWKPVPEVQWFAFNNHRLKVTGAQWQFHGMSQVPSQYQGVTHVERCVCRASRFDIDEFGRVYVPDALRSRVTVLDSEGNTLLTLGTRGNADEAKTVFYEPYATAAAADRLYIADRGLIRVVRVTLGYQAEASSQTFDQ